jgi:predicted CopG family antitoxin
LRPVFFLSTLNIQPRKEKLMATRQEPIPVPAHPEPYVRKKHTRKRGRPLKNGRPKKDRYDERRSAPSKRAGARWRSINIPEDAYFKLKEISAFYKKSMSSLMDEMVEERFNKAYEESLTLARIEANRQKARDETPDRIDPARRTHF